MTTATVPPLEVTVHRPEVAMLPIVTEWRLALPVNPVPLGRPRVGPTRTYLPRRSAQFQDDLRWLFAIAGVRRPIADPLALELVFWRHHRGNNRGDLDNLVKAVLDAGNGFLWTDDRLVVDLHARIAAHGPDVTGRVHLHARFPIALNPHPEET